MPMFSFIVLGPFKVGSATGFMGFMFEAGAIGVELWYTMLGEAKVEWRGGSGRGCCCCGGGRGGES